jgi:hypothetical protein
MPLCYPAVSELRLAPLQYTWAFPMEKGKIKCTDCGWIGTSESADQVEDPKPIEGTEPDFWLVCPECRTPENFQSLCDEPGCKKAVSCGKPTPNGYRQTCSQHMPR